MASSITASSRGKLGAYTSKLRSVVVSPSLLVRRGLPPASSSYTAASARLFSTQQRQERVTVVYIGNTRTRSPLLDIDRDFPFAGDVSSLIVYRDRAAVSKKQAEGGGELVPGAAAVMASSVGELLRVSDATKSGNVKAAAPPKLRDRLGREGDEEQEDCFEIAAVDCPRLLRKDLKELFPGQKMGERVSVLNVSQKTENDMSMWDSAMEAEREQLIMKFVDAACALCAWLKQQGYWADFIDPSSGRPFLGAFTNSTLFETDERYRELGFKIEDLGCCKVIKHAKWSTRAFIGTIFTDAPVNSEAIRQIIDVSQ